MIPKRIALGQADDDAAVDSELRVRERPPNLMLHGYLNPAAPRGRRWAGSGR